MSLPDNKFALFLFSFLLSTPILNSFPLCVCLSACLICFFLSFSDACFPQLFPCVLLLGHFLFILFFAWPRSTRFCFLPPETCPPFFHRARQCICRRFFLNPNDYCRLLRSRPLGFSLLSPIASYPPAALFLCVTWSAGHIPFSRFASSSSWPCLSSIGYSLCFSSVLVTPCFPAVGFTHRLQFLPFFSLSLSALIGQLLPFQVVGLYPALFFFTLLLSPFIFLCFPPPTIYS